MVKQARIFAVYRTESEGEMTSKVGEFAREDGGEKKGGSDSPTAKLAARPLKDPSHRASERFFSVPRFYSILARFFL